MLEPRRASRIAGSARLAAGCGRFARRSPMSAFWGCIAAAIIVMAHRRAGDRAVPAAEIRFPRHGEAAERTSIISAPTRSAATRLSRVIHGSRASLTVARCGGAVLGTTLRRALGTGERLFRRPFRHLQPAVDRVPAIVPRPDPGDGDRDGAGRRLRHVIVAIAITRIPFGGRVIRSVVLSLKEMSYVEAARGLGASHMRMMLRHILPQCVAPYLILATTHLGVAIIIEASLGFLGVGIPPPMPTWGNMLADSLNAGWCRHGGWCCSRAPRSP